MKANEVRDMSSGELETELGKMREKLFRLRFQAKGKDVESPGQLKGIRRDIARCNTILRERALADGAADGGAKAGSA